MYSKMSSMLTFYLRIDYLKRIDCTAPQNTWFSLEMLQVIYHSTISHDSHRHQTAGLVEQRLSGCNTKVSGAYLDHQSHVWAHVQSPHQLLHSSGNYKYSHTNCLQSLLTYDGHPVSKNGWRRIPAKKTNHQQNKII